MSVTDFIVQEFKKDEDTDILHRKSFDVNIRLYTSNNSYNYLIASIISYMKIIIHTNFKDYAKLKGLSGANIGVPFNIIVVVPSTTNNVITMINPKIIKKSTTTHTVKSNCGSLCLEKPIEVERYDWVDVEWYDETGNYQHDRFKGALGSTIQHEIEHNLGILISDRRN